MLVDALHAALENARTNCDFNVGCAQRARAGVASTSFNFSTRVQAICPLRLRLRQRLQAASAGLLVARFGLVSEDFRAGKMKLDHAQRTFASVRIISTEVVVHAQNQIGSVAVSTDALGRVSGGIDRQQFGNRLQDQRTLTVANSALMARAPLLHRVELWSAARQNVRRRQAFPLPSVASHRKGAK
jgi:hypothetical protein